MIFDHANFWHVFKKLIKTSSKENRQFYILLFNQLACGRNS